MRIIYEDLLFYLHSRCIIVIKCFDLYVIEYYNYNLLTVRSINIIDIYRHLCPVRIFVSRSSWTWTLKSSLAAIFVFIIILFLSFLLSISNQWDNSLFLKPYSLTLYVSCLVLYVHVWKKRNRKQLENAIIHHHQNVIK